MWRVCRVRNTQCWFFFSTLSYLSTFHFIRSDIIDEAMCSNTSVIWCKYLSSKWDESINGIKVSLRKANLVLHLCQNDTGSVTFTRKFVTIRWLRGDGSIFWKRWSDRVDIQTASLTCIMPLSLVHNICLILSPSITSISLLDSIYPSSHFDLIFHYIYSI